MNKLLIAIVMIMFSLLAPVLPVYAAQNDIKVTIINQSGFPIQYGDQTRYVRTDPATILWTHRS
jgi:hypothetical protein